MTCVDVGLGSCPCVLTCLTHYNDMQESWACASFAAHDASVCAVKIKVKISLKVVTAPLVVALTG